MHAIDAVDPSTTRFDVICAGEAHVTLESAAGPLRFEAGGGAVRSATILATMGLRVGLAAVLRDDAMGRAIREKLLTSGIGVHGLELAPPRSRLILVRGGARQAVAYGEEEDPVSIPGDWSAAVLLLSGMSPIVSHGAALCRAARAARRAGSTVVVDLDARWESWRGRDARAIRMILREADVVWANADDLVGLSIDAATLRAAMRADAVLAMNDGLGTVRATGTFGAVEAPAANERGNRVAAISAELARKRRPGESTDARWKRALVS